MSRLKALYENEVKQKLKEELNSPNVMAVPRITKIVITSYSIHYTKLYEGFMESWLSNFY